MNKMLEQAIKAVERALDAQNAELLARVEEELVAAVVVASREQETLEELRLLEEMYEDYFEEFSRIYVCDDE